MPKPNSFHKTSSCANCVHFKIIDSFKYYCLQHHFWMSDDEHICDDYEEEAD